uniref:PB1 domain-containing protein n=1 Tax=Parascaris univalens TaxID=6257 RepID=A0A915ATM4_PARUN
MDRRWLNEEYNTLPSRSPSMHQQWARGQWWFAPSPPRGPVMTETWTSLPWYEYWPYHFGGVSKFHSTLFGPRRQSFDLMGNGTDVKIKWNHYGLKHKIIISQAEIANDDLYEVLLRKIRQQRPEFDGMLAYFDSQGNQVIFASDKELREIIRHNKGRIKIYTIRPPLRNNELTHPKRSQSVPLEYRSRLNRSQRPPSTLQDAPPPYYGRYGGYLMNSLSEIPFPIAYPQVPPPGYTYTYTTYTPYGQSIVYGLPPRSMMMRSFLCSPFPFSGYHRSWVVGPKFYGHGGWGGKYRRGGYNCGWGPVF